MYPESTTAWREVEDLVSELQDLVESAASSGEFFSQTLQRTVEGLGAVSGAFWLVSEAAGLHVAYEYHREGDSTPSARESDHRFADSVLKSSQAGTLDVDPLRFAVPVPGEGGPVGVLQVNQHPTASTDIRQGHLRLLEIVSGIAADFLRRRELRRLRALQANLTRLDDFTRRIHAQLDPPATAFEIVNEGRRFIGCDRLTLVLTKDARSRAFAMSGVATIERRSSAIRALERLATDVCRGGESQWYERRDAGPRQRADVIASYADQTNASVVAILPLRSSGRDVLGALVAECFEAPADRRMRELVGLVADRAAPAVENSLAFGGMPLASVLASLGKLRRGSDRRLSKYVALAIIALIAILTLVFVPAELVVRAEGELQPALTRDVFAPLDGQVSGLLVRHDQRVEADETVLVLSSVQLDLEFQRLQGEFETARKRLQAIEAARLQFEEIGDETAGRLSQLTAEQEELIQLLASQQNQLLLLARQRKLLEVRTPIAGRVLTWDADRLLENRPVQRGQALLTVADVDGPWIAELWIPEHKLGYVLTGGSRTEKPAVSLTLVADGDTIFDGEVERIGMRSELNDDGRPGAKITVAVDRDGVSTLRPGAAVFSKIQCGQRALGYVWFADLIERVRGHLVF